MTLKKSIPNQDSTCSSCPSLQCWTCHFGFPEKFLNVKVATYVNDWRSASTSSSLLLSVDWGQARPLHFCNLKILRLPLRSLMTENSIFSNSHTLFFWLPLISTSGNLLFYVIPAVVLRFVLIFEWIAIFFCYSRNLWTLHINLCFTLLFIR